jgi:MioC protein
MQIAILYGTETGNAEMLAEDIAAHLSGHDVRVANLSDTDPAGLVPGVLQVIVCSTYGDGELPASAQPFAERMAAAQPDLTGVHFAVFGMGDSAYPETFNFGGQRMAELLAGAGATMIGTRAMHDASGSEMAEDVALPWIDAVLDVAEGLVSQAA